MTYPELNNGVRINLVTGIQVFGFWDGSSWWEELPDSPDTVLIEESNVLSWELVI